MAIVSKICEPARLPPLRFSCCSCWPSVLDVSYNNTSLTNKHFCIDYLLTYILPPAQTPLPTFAIPPQLLHACAHCGDHAASRIPVAAAIRGQHGQHTIANFRAGTPDRLREGQRAGVVGVEVGVELRVGAFCSEEECEQGETGKKRQQGEKVRARGGVPSLTMLWKLDLGK